MSGPLVSVVTPTWQRNGLLLERCIPSVQAQDYPAVEHIVVSDGPDEELAAQLRSVLPATGRQDVRQGRHHPLWYYELGAHHPPPNFGSYARRHGIDVAAGEYITYNDDDDMLRPEHCSLMAAALEANPDAGFAVSRMLSHGNEADVVIGWGPLCMGNVGSPMIMHRRSILEQGTWGPPSLVEDWEVVSKWLDAGVGYVNVDAETSEVWPSTFRGENKS